MSLSAGILYSYLLLSCHYHAGHLTYMLVLLYVFVVFCWFDQVSSLLAGLIALTAIAGRVVRHQNLAAQ